MNLDALFESESGEDGSVHLQVKNGRTMDVLGASTLINLPPNAGGVSSLIVYPEKIEERAIVAVVINADASHGAYPIILEILWQEPRTKPFLNLEHQWACDLKRRGGIAAMGSKQALVYALYAKICDKWYTTNPNVTGMCFIQDGDLLCQYLVDTIQNFDLQHLLQTATENKSVCEKIGDGLDDGLRTAKDELSQLGGQARKKTANLLRGLLKVIEEKPTAGEDDE